MSNGTDHPDITLFQIIIRRKVIIDPADAVFAYSSGMVDMVSVCFFQKCLNGGRVRSPFGDFNSRSILQSLRGLDGDPVSLFEP